MEVDCVRTHRHWTAPSLEVRRQQRTRRGRRTCQRLADRQEALSPEALDYVALWIEAKYVQDSPKAEPFTIVLCTDMLAYRGQTDRHRTSLVLAFFKTKEIAVARIFISLSMQWCIAA